MMRARVKYVIGKSTKVETMDVIKLSFASVAKQLKISPRQIISVIKEI